MLVPVQGMVVRVEFSSVLADWVGVVLQLFPELGLQKQHPWLLSEQVTGLTVLLKHLMMPALFPLVLA